MSLPYVLGDRIGKRATLGLIVLQTDQTVEHDLHRIFAADDIAIYVSRVPSGADVTPETLAAMEAEMPRAARLLPHALDYDAIGYACTSGATVIGPARVAEQVRSGANVAHVTNPLSAVVAGCRALDVRRIGLMSPYIASVTAPLEAALEAQGIDVVRSVSFDESDDARVACIDPASIRAAALEADAGDVEAVFLSCTNLRTMSILDDIEQVLGKPAISSNQALAWHMARLAGLDGGLGPGQLWRLPLAG